MDRSECDVWNSGRICKNIFWSFFQQNPTFKASVMKTERYKRLKERFQCNTSEAYLSFMCFITRFWSVSLEVSVWTANDSPATSLYGRVDSVHYDQIHKEKVPCTWGWLSKKSRRYCIFWSIEIRSKFNWFYFSSNDALGIYLVKIHQTKVSAWCSKMERKQRFWIFK